MEENVKKIKNQDHYWLFISENISGINLKIPVWTPRLGPLGNNEYSLPPSAVSGEKLISDK